MLKNLTFIAAACLFATTGCTLTIGGGTDSDSDTASSTDASAGSTSASTSSASTSGGSTSDGSGTTAETSPTTTSPTTTAATSSTSGSTTDASGSSGGMSAYGNCGWFADGGYYTCGPDGSPGVADPMGTNPIDCPDVLPMIGDKCDEMGPVTGQGCCTPTGDNYYCDNNGQVTMDACGA